MKNGNVIQIVCRMVELSGGKSLEEIAKDINVSTATIYDWYNGKHVPQLYILMHICEYYGCSADYLLFGRTEAK